MPWLPLLWCWEEEGPSAFEYVILLRHVVLCTTVVVPLPRPSLGASHLSTGTLFTSRYVTSTSRKDITHQQSIAVVREHHKAVAHLNRP